MWLQNCKRGGGRVFTVFRTRAYNDSHNQARAERSKYHKNSASRALVDAVVRHRNRRSLHSLSHLVPSEYPTISIITSSFHTFPAFCFALASITIGGLESVYAITPLSLPGSIFTLLSNLCRTSSFPVTASLNIYSHLRLITCLVPLFLNLNLYSNALSDAIGTSSGVI